MATCYLGIGSNLGKRRQNINIAVDKIKKLKNTKVLKISRIIETKPLGGPPNQNKFLNSVLKINTGISCPQLLKNLKKIEKKIGRKKTVRNGPRIIDLDILFYADRIIDKPKLKIPHPKVFERKFVVRPLLEVL